MIAAAEVKPLLDAVFGAKADVGQHSLFAVRQMLDHHRDREAFKDEVTRHRDNILRSKQPKK